MPVESTIIAVDLLPIKPIHGVKAFQGDITTQKCRRMWCYTMVPRMWVEVGTRMPSTRWCVSTHHNA